jgi:glycosyltransferase involved in cell wall biosynthesis
VPVLIERSHGTSISGGYLANVKIAESAGIELIQADDLTSLRTLLASRAGEEILLDSIFLFDPGLAPDVFPSKSRVRLLAHSLPSLLPGRPREVRRADLAREQTLLTLFAGAIAPSRFLAAALARRGLHADRVDIVPLAPISDGRADGDTRRAGARETVRVLSVAHVVRAKGYPDAARALAQFGEIPWRWTIVGRTDIEAECVNEVRRVLGEHGLERRVVFVERREPADMASVYRESDLMLLPSYMESFGLAFAEAMTYGVPVVGYRVAAVPEVVGTGGILAAPGRTDGLVRALRTITRDAAAADRARHAAALLPTWPDVGRSIRRVLEGDDR